MKRVFIVHRWSGGPGDDWRPWLKGELEKRGFEVFVPEMPDTETPVIEKWVSHLSSLVRTPDGQTFFVGHSIGCQTILRYLETINTSVGGALFIAGWFRLENLEDEETIAIAKPWMETLVNAVKIRRVLPSSTLVISDNDPYGAFEENKRKFEELGSRIVVLNGAGHVTEEDGFVEVPMILEAVLRLAKE